MLFRASKRWSALTIVLVLGLLWITAERGVQQAQRLQKRAAHEAPPQAFFAANCFTCHSAELKSGSLDLEQHFKSISFTENREVWEKVLQKIRSGEMPPKGLPRPDSNEIAQVARWIESGFERADRMAGPNPGRVTARRLNRAEYNNTIRDLLAVKSAPADDFPQDDSGYGFDNIGDVLSLSPVLMEKYLAQAEKIARTALFGPEPVKPVLNRLQVPGRRVVPNLTALHDYDVTGLGLPNALHVTHRVPATGEYAIRAFLGGVRPLASEPIRLALWVDGKEMQVVPVDGELEAAFDMDRQDFAAKTRDFRVRLTAGEHWIALTPLNLYEGLPAKYGGPSPSKRKGPPERQFRAPPNAPPARVAELRKQFEERRAEKPPLNDFRINAIELGGPYKQEMAPSLESLKKIYVCGHLDGRHETGCERRIVMSLARRVYRRPATASEIDDLLRLSASVKKEGGTFADGISLSLQAMLVSPHFLFRIEKDESRSRVAKGRAYSISAHALAARLSYFLWSSTPDAGLDRCADDGSLRRPAVLAQQVKRMLKDPRSRTLAENFAGQWLELRKLESVKPDRQRFPEFEEYLRMSMLRETELFFDEIVRQDRSILDFIDADYTFLNERLARFYRIPGVTGTDFRRVSLKGTERGGLLTQASILTVSSYATRTSPVLRGRWILENVLNAPPPPPPPGVPNLDENKAVSAASLRQELEEHRKNTTCASCHARMDPLGFGLENFDAIGGWRTKDGTAPIDASGTLPDGRSFKGVGELKSIVKQDRGAFTECVTEKMLTYALGRGLERYDRQAIKTIARGVEANGYHFSALVYEIVKSLPFQQRRGG